MAALGGSVACVSCPTLFRTLKARVLRPPRQRPPVLTCVAACSHSQDDFPAVACHLLEYDERYSCRGDFSFYDYNEPLRVPEALHGAFDVVVADPPYLAEECLVKTAECVAKRWQPRNLQSTDAVTRLAAAIRTVRLLQRRPDSHVLLLTGAIMQHVAERALGCRPCVFRPQHSSKLGNDFYLYASYNAERLGGWDATLQPEDGSRPAAA